MQISSDSIKKLVNDISKILEIAGFQKIPLKKWNPDKGNELLHYVNIKHPKDQDIFLLEISLERESPHDPTDGISQL